MPESTSVSQATPVSVSERIDSIDVLRGFALLGILMINIYFFALPGGVMFNPTIAGGFTGLDLLTWEFTSLFFLQKMAGIFSMLFGAGIILMFNRAEAKGRKFGGIHYRRMFWLIIIGLVHGYLIWHGDILFTYALCGMLLFLFRRRSPRLLISLAVVFFLVGLVVQVGAGQMFMFLRDGADEARQLLGEGKQPSSLQKNLLDSWNEVSGYFDMPQDMIDEEIAACRGGFGDVLMFRLPQTMMMQTQALIFIVCWRTLGLMLLGMGLMKLGIFSALRSKRFYVILTVVGYVLGLPTILYGIRELVAHDFDFIYQFCIGMNYNYIGSIFAALGHVGLIMLLCKYGPLKGLLSRLAAVGRTALSNYLLTSVVMTTIFYGYGLGLFARVDRFYLMFFVLGMWVVQLIISPLWLRHYYYGPAEWLWRALTYRRKPRMKIS